MQNILKIEGGRTRIINPNTNYDLDLRAFYKDIQYDFSKVTGALQVMILHFARQENILVPDGLNVVLLMTTGNGHYRATGLTRYDIGDGKPQMYAIGDDLEIILAASADQTIKELPRRL